MFCRVWVRKQKQRPSVISSRDALKEMLFLTDLLDHGDGNIVDTENLSVIKKLNPVHGYYCYLFLQFFAITVFFLECFMVLLPSNSCCTVRC